MLFYIMKCSELGFDVFIEVIIVVVEGWVYVVEDLMNIILFE